MLNSSRLANLPDSFRYCCWTFKWHT